MSSCIGPVRRSIPSPRLRRTDGRRHRSGARTRTSARQRGSFRASCHPPRARTSFARAIMTSAGYNPRPMTRRGVRPGARRRAPRVLTGIEVLARSRPRWLRDRRVGLLMHPASVTSRFVSSRQVVTDLLGAKSLRALFGPQHGIAGEKQDNMIESGHGADADLGIPIYSLYSETRSPTPKMLQDIDVLLVDLQDVGTRVYTFEWTVALALEACAQMGKEVVVLDRPNPLGGEALEGNLIRPGYTSFVGLYPVPMRHGLTLGELAALVNLRMADGPGRPVRRTDGIGVRCPGRCALPVVPVEGWRRRMRFPDTGLPCVLPSPNMPTFDTAVVYPGQVLLEGTNVSEGRGTTRPVEIFGAPWIDPEKFCRELNGLKLPGTYFREMFFQPTFQKFAGELCGGAQLHVTDRDSFRSFETGLEVIRCSRRMNANHFQWKQPPYEYEFKRLPIEVLLGGPASEFFPN